MLQWDAREWGASETLQQISEECILQFTVYTDPHVCTTRCILNTLSECQWMEGGEVLLDPLPDITLFDIIQRVSLQNHLGDVSFTACHTHLH